MTTPPAPASGLDPESLRLFRIGRDRLHHADLCVYLFGAAAFQYLNAGCALGVFERLHRERSLSHAELIAALGLKDVPTRCLLLGLKSLGLLVDVDGRYRNCLAIEHLFAEGEWEMFHGTVLLEAHIVYMGQVDFVESLREGRNVGLRRIEGEGDTVYQRLTQHPELQKVFYRYMSAWSNYAHPLLLKHLDFSTTKRVLDVGGGDGTNAIELCRHYAGLRATVLDLPKVAPIARARVAEAGMAERIDVAEGDMFALGAFPAGYDCLMFVHQLVIWSLEKNTELLRKAYEALPSGGRVVIFNMMADDDRSGPPFAALASVYFVAIAAGEGMIYAWKDYEDCLTRAGFRRFERIPCGSWTPHGVLVATKD